MSAEKLAQEIMIGLDSYTMQESTSLTACCSNYCGGDIEAAELSVISGQSCETHGFHMFSRPIIGIRRLAFQKAKEQSTSMTIPLICFQFL